MNRITTYTSLLLLTVGLSAGAQEAPHSDIEFQYLHGAIQVEEGDEGFVFEGEFGEGAFANEASEPGIASELEEGMGIHPGNTIAFNVLNSLYYWDGNHFALPGETSLTISGVGGSADTVISATSGIQRSSFATPANLLGQADAEGSFHVDPKFTISDGAPAGGYGLLLSLSTDDDAAIADSAPFGVMLNFGLEEAAFEAGVEAFGAIVPEPSSFHIFALSLVGFGWLRSRRAYRDCRGNQVVSAEILGSKRRTS